MLGLTELSAQSEAKNGFVCLAVHFRRHSKIFGHSIIRFALHRTHDACVCDNVEEEKEESESEDDGFEFEGAKEKGELHHEEIDASLIDNI